MYPKGSKVLYYRVCVGSVLGILIKVLGKCFVFEYLDPQGTVLCALIGSIHQHLRAAGILTYPLQGTSGLHPKPRGSTSTAASHRGRTAT